MDPSRHPGSDAERSSLRSAGSWHPAAAIVFIAGCVAAASLFAQGVPRQSELELVDVVPDFYMIAGAGGNIAVNLGVDGVIIVDTGSASRADQVLALIRRLTPKPIRYIINTGADPDHVGGNDKLSLAGVPILPAGYRREGLAGREFAPILAEQHVQDRMTSGSDKQPAAPSTAWPTSTYSIEAGESQRKLFLNGQGIQVMHLNAAHSDADSMVHFRRSDVLVVGDLIDLDGFPVIDVAHGGTVQGVIDGLNRVLDLSISSTPFPFQEGGTLIIPGHGRLCTTTDVVEYRDMVTVIRDVVQDGVRKKLTLAQVQASNPAQGYRRRYGSDSGAWTTKLFIETIYNELNRKQEASP